MIRSILSRLTMKRVRHEFIDRVTGEDVFLFTDRYGDYWLANSKLGLRMKKQPPQRAGEE